MKGARINMFAVHVWGELHQSKKIKVPPGATVEQLDAMLKARHERGRYIDQLTHYGPLGSIGTVDYVNSLAGN